MTPCPMNKLAAKGIVPIHVIEASKEFARRKEYL